MYPKYPDVCSILYSNNMNCFGSQNPALRLGGERKESCFFTRTCHTNRIVRTLGTGCQVGSCDTCVTRGRMARNSNIFMTFSYVRKQSVHCKSTSNSNWRRKKNSFFKYSSLVVVLYSIYKNRPTLLAIPKSRNLALLWPFPCCLNLDS